MRTLAIVVGLSLFASFASADVHAHRVMLARITSAELRAVHQGVATALRAARRSAPPRSGAPQPLGRTYAERAYRLASDDATGLGDMVHVWLHPDADDEAWFERIGAATIDASHVASTLGATPGGPFAVAAPPAEIAAREALATALVGASTAHPSLQAFSVQCGWGDVVGGAYLGIAFVDPSTHEVLWVLSEETWNDGE